jgi:Skp family chaperone for outer membrane proteins
MRLLRPVVLLAALFAVMVITAPVASAADTEAPRIAVLRLYDVMIGFTRYTAGKDKIKADMAGGQAKIHTMEERMDQLHTATDSLKPESDAYAKAELEFEQTKIAVKQMVDRGNADIQAKHMALIKDCYARLHDCLADYCKEKGIKLVHLAPNPDIDAQNPQELSNELFMQDVLYFDPSYDITDAFIPYLNAHVPAGSTSGVPSMLAAPDASASGGSTGTGTAPATASATPAAATP